MRIIILVVMSLSFCLFSQVNLSVHDFKNEPSASAPLEPLFGEKTVYLFITNYAGEVDGMKMEFTYEDTDPTKAMPVMFTWIDDNGEEVPIREYLYNGGSPITLSYWDYLERALPHYFSKMSQEKLDLRIEFQKNPNNGNGVWELTGTRAYYQSLDSDVRQSRVEYELEDVTTTIAPEIFGGEGGIWSKEDDYLETQFLNFIEPDINRYSGVVWGNNTWTQMDSGLNFNDWVMTLVHELGHTVYAIGDKGQTGARYYGNIDGVFMGQAGSQTCPYDLMFHDGMKTGPYSIFNFNTFHTQDLLHQGYITEDEILITPEDQTNQNYYQTGIKAIRANLTDDELADPNIYRAIKVPIEIDLNETDDWAYPIGSMVEKQHFLIEFRNGQGYDKISSLGNEGLCNGILISHVNNEDGGEGYPAMLDASIIDVEIATPYPETWGNGIDPYRNPDSTSTSYNGEYYNGRECPDWLDDFNYNQYQPQGGSSAYEKVETYGSCSLPTDFFNDTVRNKFTPSTRPSSCSWKMKDTHIGVYIDNIDYENDYANLRIYRNYWSLPLTEEYLAVNNDGKSVVGLDDYCYFGDNFSVDPGIQIWLGNGTEEMKATLVPGTDMVMKENSFLMLANNTMLRLEDSKLTFLSGSKYQPNDVAEIELEDSELNFNDGFVFCPLGEETLNRFDINVSGNSSIYNSDLELINNSLLIIRENSELVLKKGTNLRIPSGASLILEDNASLIIERGANLTIDPDAVLQFGEGAEVSLKWGSLFVMDGAINYGIGIYAEYGSSIYIRNSVFTNTGTGVRGTPSKCVIQNSTFEGCRAGVSIEGCDYMEITDNTFTGIDVGVGLSIDTKLRIYTEKYHREF